MYDLTYNINKVLPSSSFSNIMAYDYSTNISYIKTYQSSPSTVAKYMENVIKRLDFDLKNNYLVIPRKKSIFICMWSNDEEHYEALKTRFTIEMEDLLELKKPVLNKMQELTTTLQDMVIIKQSLDSTTIELAKSLTKESNE